MVTLPLARRASQDTVKRDVRANIVAFLLFGVPLAAGIWGAVALDTPWPSFVALGLGFTLMQSPKVAKQWERAVVLRLGRYIGLRGPGIFWIVPFVDTVTKWI